MVHQGLGHSIPCSFIVMSSQDTSRVTHEPISTGFREAIQGNTRQYKAIRSEREICLPPDMAAFHTIAAAAEIMQIVAEPGESLPSLADRVVEAVGCVVTTVTPAPGDLDLDLAHAV